MAPQKPSPHRFIAPSTPSHPKPKPTSTLRHALTSTPTPTTTTPKHPTPLKRFVLAPPRKKDVAAPLLSSHDIAPRKRKLERVESIEEVVSSPVRGDDGSKEDIVHSIEGATFPHTRDKSEEQEDEEREEDEENGEEEMLFASLPLPRKHHRTTPPPPHHTLEPLSSRFLPPIPPTTTTSTSTSNTLPLSTTTTTRPHFLPPPPSTTTHPQTPHATLFSPTRRGQKYISCGLASGMQALILDASQSQLTSSSAGTPWRKSNDVDVMVRIKVVTIPPDGDADGEVRCRNGTVTLLRGIVQTILNDDNDNNDDDDDDDAHSSHIDPSADREIGVLLSGTGGKSTVGVVVRVGSVVGIRAPTWEVSVAGEVWVVGVEWGVL